ncbi:hypothetical protein SAMN04487977_101651 [Treponema bryantii]|uniref:Uncharacterized protein n=1 Tax=Treponema bryantii TaxID=163 RepID=A0A1H9BE60_9SPIR|nr:hypothetical protein [Treponema bryantii]BDC93460.1 hypothetical protein TRBR_15570 [Treponema bryantii]SEP86558.1 hypothetical protein SAMN04487977_101651 [Treponema bryantii]
MIYFYTFLYYSLFSSVVLIYGIGLNKIAEIGIVKFKEPIFYVKCSVSIISSSVISWLLTYYLLVPLQITELYPLICFIVYASISTFLGGIVRLTTGRLTSEFAVSYLVILLSITESSSLLFTLFISVCCLLSMLIIIPFSLTFRRRVCSNGRFLDEKYYSLYFLFLAILILLLSVWDIVWLNPEVIK